MISSQAPGRRHCLSRALTWLSCLTLAGLQLTGCSLGASAGPVAAPSPIAVPDATPPRGPDAPSDLTAVREAIAAATPGSTVVIPDGTYRDEELVFTGAGTAAKPILLEAETPGGVVFSGRSNLRMSGEHLVIKGLVFRDGFTEVGEVISLRTSAEDLCNDCRVTECVIDNYNNPERSENDIWVVVYGKRNRVDHCHLTGKRNLGVTMAVRLNTEASRDNGHRIDHNYFGPRPILGSNGGETLRIGTSHYSMTNSNTLVEYNYFDRCNGEHEIISNKSGGNVFRRNTFFECQGTLTMRHGNGTLVEDNFFFGNRKSNTGGIRIINASQTVRNNYGEGLTGYRFRGALVVMNGVPDSPINRYFQVVDSRADDNTFVDCDYVQLAAGSDEERSATPEDTDMRRNIFHNTGKDDIFTVYDDVSGITFSDNVVSPNVELFQEEGFVKRQLDFERRDGVLVPVGVEGVGRQGTNERATPDNTGVDWYERRDQDAVFGTGRVTSISGDGDALYDAIAASGPGDVLELAPGTYVLRRTATLRHPLTLRGADGDRAAVRLRFERPNLFALENGGALSLQRLTVDGADAPDYAGNAVVRTSRYSMTHNYKLLLEACDFVDLDVNHSFNVLEAAKSTFADSIAAVDCTFRDVSGAVFALSKETDDRGVYGVENLVVRGCTFEDIGQQAIDLYRGGGDESTFGPMLALSSSEFRNVGQDRRNRTGAAVRLHGVQFAEIDDNTYVASGPLDMHLSVGEPVIRLRRNDFSRSAPLVSNSDAYEITPR